mmetsp:Transcript_10521/g.17662  ORF Transcript_10521/g.17662 Transcript_10521/m.17662 type:complete len:532 (+) Transcript_10521:80-1675(+)|eukprot:CAMPEP_0119343900 /NCGR_PEP_ID=MMETSP1333-20130426/106400_1 /TAXON_ID=418940 /ORGANISM="Scyphosphaera apsteinii, Strain RCC1455" /LENGTH=531 /DNA_ID=CAMNT_0007356319 /DNA_START=82 /DNA_END=1677 /DNA_ORIENTATION=+
MVIMSVKSEQMLDELLKIDDRPTCKGLSVPPTAKEPKKNHKRLSPQVINNMAALPTVLNNISKATASKKCPTEAFQAQRKWLRMQEFALIYVSYMTFLAARKNYGFWLPSVLSDLGKSKGEAGVLGSSFEIIYGVSAVLNGVLIDMYSPKMLLVVGLLGGAALNLSIAASSSLPVMACLWGFHGLVQSVGWPSVTNIFLAWFPDPASRGAWYATLSTCQNAGAAALPLLLSVAISLFGSKAALYVPALMCCFVAAVLALFLAGSPAASYARHTGSGSQGTLPKPRPTPPSARKLRDAVLLNRQLWLMGITYFCISMVRTFLSDWSTLFLREAKGMPLTGSSRCLFLMEIGGFLGSLAAGSISDKVFRGRRGPVVCLCSSLLAPSLLGLVWARSALTLQACYAAIGFCAFPVHVLLGLFAREVVPPSIGSSAGGFIKCIAQVGGAMAGLPLGILQQHFGVELVLLLLVAMALLSGVAAAPLWSTRAGEQRVIGGKKEQTQSKILARNGSAADFNQMHAGVKVHRKSVGSKLE